MWFFVAILITFCLPIDYVAAQMRTVRCVVHDPEQIRVSLCITRAIQRDVTESSFRATLLKPIKNATVIIKLMKKSNRFSLFFAEQKIDGCKFFSQRNSYPIGNNLYKLMEPYTNINHSCPYTDEVFITKFRVDPKQFSWLPIPDGNYAFYITWLVAGKPMLDTNVYFTFKEH